MENDFCDRIYRPGEVIMNAQSIESEERSIIVSRGNKLLSSLSSYFSNEFLVVSINKTGGDLLFQVENATFVGGGCQGIRTSKNLQTIKLPSDDLIVKIWVGKLNHFTFFFFFLLSISILIN